MGNTGLFNAILLSSFSIKNKSQLCGRLLQKTYLIVALSRGSFLKFLDILL